MRGVGRLSRHSYKKSTLIKIHQINTMLINVYRPPDCKAMKFSQVIETIKSILNNTELNDTSAPSILMVGDFNFPFIQWPQGKIYMRDEEPSSMSSEKEQAKMLLEWAEANLLEQKISTATRKENILDLVFTNKEDLIQDYETIINSKLSDHKLMIKTSKNLI